MNYCAFISYRHLKPDMLVAKRLHAAIETYHIPTAIQKRIGRKRMGRVFRDAEELPLSSDLGADIEEALDNSEWFIAVCSPEYLKSKWCMRELEYFIERHGVNRVLAVLVDGEPDNSFPEILCYGLDSEGKRTRIEPLAADVRERDVSKKLLKLNQEKLRLLAPMLTVSYDDLKRRERQRKIRIALAAASATLAVSLGIVSYVIASNKRAEALKQEAEEQRIQAEIERRAAANNNIGELIEKASSYLIENERRKAASSLLAAVAISEATDDIRREEIISLLRRVMYIAPFTPVDTLVDNNLQITGITVSKDEKYAVGIENGNTIALIRLSSNTMEYRIPMNTVEIDDLEFSPDSKRFLAICENGRYVQIWNTEDGSLAFSYYSEKDSDMQIANARFWRDSDTLLVQDWDTFYIVKTDGNKQAFYTIGAMQEGYSNDSNLYTSMSNGASVKSFFKTTRKDFMETDMAFSGDYSRVLISGMLGETGTIILDESGNRVCLLQGMPATFAEKYTFSPDGKYISCLSNFGFIATWDAVSGELIYIYQAIENATFSVLKSKIVFSPDSSRFAYVFNDTLAIWDTVNGKFLTQLTLKGEKYDNPIVSYSKDGNYLFVTFENMYFLDAKDGYPLMIMTGNPTMRYTNCIPLRDTVLLSRTGVNATFYSLPTVSSVYSTDYFGDKLCDSFDSTQTKKKWDTLPKGEHQLSESSLISLANYGYENEPGLFFSEDSETAAITYPDGTIELFKREGDGKIDAVIKPFSSWTNWNTSLAMNSRYLVASGGASQFVVFNLLSNTIMLNNPASFYYDKFCFNKSGNQVMALGTGGYGISVYDIENGELLFDMGPNEKFDSFAFSLDGSYAVGKTDRGYLIGNMLLDETDLISRARRLVEAIE